MRHSPGRSRPSRKPFALLACLVIWTGAANTATAQSAGSITGIVTDAVSGQPIEAVQVSVPELGIGVQSLAEGRFVLVGVPAGTYEVRAEIIGHLAASESVVVPADGAVFVGFRLHPTALQLQEVVVTGTAFEESPVDLP